MCECCINTADEDETEDEPTVETEAVEDDQVKA